MKKTTYKELSEDMGVERHVVADTAKSIPNFSLADGLDACRRAICRAWAAERRNAPLDLAEVRLETARAKLIVEEEKGKKLKFERLIVEGKYIERAVVLDEWKEQQIHINKSLSTLPSRVAPKLVNQSNIHDVIDALTVEVNHTLSELNEPI